MDALNNALARYPEIARLIGPAPETLASLHASWDRGATRSEMHPLVHLLLCPDDDAQRVRRLQMLEDGLAALALPEAELAPFRTRVNCEVPEAITKRQAEKDCTAALTELYLAGRFAVAGVRPRLVPADEDLGSTPDVEVAGADDPLTLEVRSVFGDENVDLDNDERSEAFHAWNPRADEVPDNIRGQATARIENEGTIKILEGDGHPLGEGTIAAQVKRLALRKSPYRQLRGRPNPVLVLSFWHAWGVTKSDCNNVNEHRRFGRTSGPLYAAAVGRTGDPLYVGHFAHSLPPEVQTVDGHLVRTDHLAGILYLFFDGTAALFANLRAAAPALDPDAVAAIEGAFGLSVIDQQPGSWSLRAPQSPGAACGRLIRP